jgi:mRNA-degrading endonuclease toxin of MazEF toxin-antitoxin module
MAIFDPWSVIVVPFPFVDRRETKRRPAIVLSPRAFQSAHGCAVLGMITDARNLPWPSDVPLADLGAAGLRFDSVFRCKVFTLDAGFILARIGVLARRDRLAVGRALRTAMVR